MERTFEALLVNQCAPTLTGMKPASLFRYQGRVPGEARRLAECWARQLAPRGLTLRVLKTCRVTGACMLLLYREDWLRRILAERSNRRFLEQQGYPADADLPQLLERLSDRLCLEQDYPHEIGLFLGYPLEDVVGFIENRGRNYTFCGYWKAYGDPAAARRRFAQYRCCTEMCSRRFRQGATILELIAA